MHRRAIELTVFGTTDPGRTRHHNEDDFLVAAWDAKEGNTPEGVLRTVSLRAAPVLLAVADGLGGENAGEVASELTLSSLEHTLRDLLGCFSPAAALAQAVRTVNDEVIKAARKPEQTGMAATLVAVLVVGDSAYVTSVGDSRLYVAREGRLAQVTTDQNLLQQVREAGADTPSPADVSRYKNTLLQAVGRAPIHEIRVDRIALRRGDVLLLCTDGLTNELRDDDINLILTTEPSLDTASRQLVSLANVRGGRDNITVVLAGVSGGASLPMPGELISRNELRVHG